jgi:membrane-bound lytic murein transglycosylase A
MIGRRRTRFASPLGAVLLVSLLAACVAVVPPPERLSLKPVSFAALAGWQEDDVAAALPAFRKSCAAFDKLADSAAIGPAALHSVAGDWRKPCAAAAALPLSGTGGAAVSRQFFETYFIPYAAGNNAVHEGLFTGYYEPELNGARHSGGVYRTPILARPADLVMVDLGRFRPAWRGERIAGRVVNGNLTPYETRAQIEHDALGHNRQALLWVDDPVDAYFLQVQGSGRVRLADGTMVRLGYDGQNGRAYVAIGRLLVQRGEMSLDAVTQEAIRGWIKSHAQQGVALMDENPSYVFFKERQGDGPIGAQGVVLTPGRSLAVDPAFIPLGAPLYVDIADPAARLQRLVMAQDTGGAIRGPVRGDVFWGFGKEAEARAGNMRAKGIYYLLLPKSLAPPDIVATIGHGKGAIAAYMN